MLESSTCNLNQKVFFFFFCNDKVKRRVNTTTEDVEDQTVTCSPEAIFRVTILRIDNYTRTSLRMVLRQM